MTSQEVGLKIALYFAECDKIKATPRMEEITRLIELYNPNISGVIAEKQYNFISGISYPSENKQCPVCGEWGADHLSSFPDGWTHYNCCESCQISENRACPTCHNRTKSWFAGEKCWKCNTLLTKENLLHYDEKGKLIING